MIGTMFNLFLRNPFRFGGDFLVSCREIFYVWFKIYSNKRYIRSKKDKMLLRWMKIRKIRNYQKVRELRIENYMAMQKKAEEMGVPLNVIRGQYEPIFDQFDETIEKIEKEQKKN
jgi:hypothetical protein